MKHDYPEDFIRKPSDTDYVILLNWCSSQKGKATVYYNGRHICGSVPHKTEFAPVRLDLPHWYFKPFHPDTYAALIEKNKYERDRYRT